MIWQFTRISRQISTTSVGFCAASSTGLVKWFGLIEVATATKGMVFRQPQPWHPISLAMVLALCQRRSILLFLQMCFPFLALVLLPLARIPHLFGTQLPAVNVCSFVHICLTIFAVGAPCGSSRLVSRSRRNLHQSSEIQPGRSSGLFSDFFWEEHLSRLVLTTAERLSRVRQPSCPWMLSLGSIILVFPPWQ